MKLVNIVDVPELVKTNVEEYVNDPLGLLTVVGYKDLEQDNLWAIHVEPLLGPCGVGVFTADGEPVFVLDPRYPGADLVHQASDLFHKKPETV